MYKGYYMYTTYTGIQGTLHVYYIYRYTRDITCILHIQIYKGYYMYTTYTDIQEILHVYYIYRYTRDITCILHIQIYKGYYKYHNKKDAKYNKKYNFLEHVENKPL